MSNIPKLMKEATLVLWHKGSTSNKRIIRFIDDTMESLLRAGIKFDFQIAYQEDREHYVDQGIKAFPFFQLDDTQLASADQIMKFLTTMMSGSQKKQKDRTPDDDMHDFMMSSLGGEENQDNEEDEDNDESGMGDFRSRMSEELERRGMGGGATADTQSSDRKSKRAPVPPSTSRDVAPRPMSQTASRPPRRPVRKESRPAPSRGNNMGESKISDVVSSLKHSSGDQKRDDELMAQFFKSQEVTAM
jgi:hypothetical protein